MKGWGGSQYLAQAGWSGFTGRRWHPRIRLHLFWHRYIAASCSLAVCTLDLKHCVLWIVLVNIIPTMKPSISFVPLLAGAVHGACTRAKTASSLPATSISTIASSVSTAAAVATSSTSASTTVSSANSTSSSFSKTDGVLFNIDGVSQYYAGTNCYWYVSQFSSGCCSATG
jgi:hypothetical protein